MWAKKQEGQGREYPGHNQWMKYEVFLVNKICGSWSQIYDMSVKSKPNYLVSQRGSGISAYIILCNVTQPTSRRFRDLLIINSKMKTI